MRKEDAAGAGRPSAGMHLRQAAHCQLRLLGSLRHRESIHRRHRAVHLGHIDVSCRTSPTSAPASAEPVGFEGWEDLLRSWRDGLRPDLDLTVSGWADRHRVLSSRAAAEPGRYRTARTPYMRAIMDALSTTHPAQRVVFMKAAQVGATEAGNKWIGYVIHHAPGPMLAVQPTVAAADRRAHP